MLVNSWNEWDPLRTVVVGSATNACFEPIEPACRPQVRGAAGLATEFPAGAKSPKVINRANAQLEGLKTILEAQGITVYRPDPPDFSQGVHTPTFHVETQYCAVCPRDVLLTIGREVIEATMSRRARYFEYLAYRPTIYAHWRNDPGMTWTAAPKPTMANEMYREEFWEWPLEARWQRMHAFEFCVTQDEVVFDAADICRCGRDIFVQESMTTNRNGIEWLRRHLEPRGLRVHSLHFPMDLFPSHIDCTFVPLRPGLVLTNPERPLAKEECRLFYDNGWELVEAPHPVCSNEEMPTYCQSSKWLSMNLLSLSPRKVLCEAREKPLQDFLEKLGFDVLSVPFRDVYEFGGSLHCATWDIWRDGDCEDYFPLQEG